MSASELLRQSMQNLRVVETKSTLPPLVPFRFTVRPHKLKLSYPPRQRYKQNYGFWLSDEWLAELGKNIRLPEDSYDPPTQKDFWKRGFAHIRGCVDIDPLTIENCFQPQTNGAPTEYLDVDGEVVVLSVCSDDEDEIPVIPWQEEVDYLANILGRPPQWWVNIYPRNDWE
ncbi:uncharacterized protein BJ212DRAFT_1582393 [Suillus subaureus]|uniref:Uncharacterized protein n=1 Tax=Suillus subaureus TaxID=48587 RepID=A0A9P7DIQ4_9AGAM|nr:uncharacterized protein BJ212DRAFT_1582393 [Suillus subaureus]KAG1796127.1 hypothetical protein BJ212DRAFT_1582393 [Suillus subaureus]